MKERTNTELRNNTEAANSSILQETRKKIKAKIYSITEGRSKYRKNFTEYDKLERTNKSQLSSKITKYLGEKSKAVLAVVVQKLKRNRTEFVANHEYLAKITNRGTRQNLNIINELRDYFAITFHGKYEHEGKTYYNCYVFKNLEIEEECTKKIAGSESALNPANKRDTGDNYRGKNNSSKRTRSNARAHEAKILEQNNSNNSKTELVENTETEKPTTESAEIKPLVSKKKFKSNARKKPIAAERKANKANIYKFNQYEKPKSLAEHYPLSQEDCYKLQELSGKAYNLNAMNEILLDMSRKPKLQGNSFVSKAKFMSYMTKTYQEEGREVDKANSPTFKIMKRRPQAEVEEIVTLNQREKYLNQVENSGIHARCDFTQLRARIAGQFPINLAYTLLTSMIGVKRQENVLKLTMHKQVLLSQHYKQLLLKHATGVGEYAGVSELEFMGVASNSNIASELPRNCERQNAEISQSTVVPDLTQREELQLPQGNWGKVCSTFVVERENGTALYKHWLSDLEAVEVPETNTIQLKANSDMVRDRIEQNYLPFLSKVASEFGIKKVEFVA